MIPERFRSAYNQAAAARSKLVAAASTLVLLGALTQPAVASPSKAPAAAGDNSHWMADNAAAIGQRYLQQVILPGAHDAGTYEGTNQPIAQAQDKSFIDQLRFGTRYFDLRAKYVGGRQNEGLADDYYFYHGVVNSSVKLTTLIDQVAEFYASSANQKEITILDFSGVTNEVGDVSGDGDPNGRLGQVCASFQQKLGPYLLDQSALAKDTDIGHMTVNQIWSLPGTPRIITNLGQCTAAGYWPLNATFGGYYANQCYVEPYTLYHGIYSSLADGMDARKSPPNFFVLGVAATPTSDCFLPLYYLNIQQQQEILALDKVKSWFDNNEHNARRDLNIIYGDYVANTSLVDYAIAMNQAGPTVTIGGSATMPAQPLSPGQTVNVSCNPDAKQPVSKLEVTGQPTASTNNPHDRLLVQVKSVADNAAHLLVATCTDASGRVGRTALPIAHAPTATPVWIINRDQRILYFDAASSTWTAVDGGGTRIAVARDGQPWVVNSDGQVWRRNPAPPATATVPGASSRPPARARHCHRLGRLGLGARPARIRRWHPHRAVLRRQQPDLHASECNRGAAYGGAGRSTLGHQRRGEGGDRGAEWHRLEHSHSSERLPAQLSHGRLAERAWPERAARQPGRGAARHRVVHRIRSQRADLSVRRGCPHLVQLGTAAGIDLAADADGVWTANEGGQVWRFSLASGTWTLIEQRRWRHRDRREHSAARQLAYAATTLEGDATPRQRHVAGRCLAVRSSGRHTLEEVLLSWQEHRLMPWRHSSPTVMQAAEPALVRSVTASCSPSVDSVLTLD